MYSQFIAGNVKTLQLFHFNSFTLQSNSYHKSKYLKDTHTHMKQDKVAATSNLSSFLLI